MKKTPAKFSIQLQRVQGPSLSILLHNKISVYCGHWRKLIQIPKENSVRKEEGMEIGEAFDFRAAVSKLYERNIGMQADFKCSKNKIFGPPCRGLPRRSPVFERSLDRGTCLCSSEHGPLLSGCQSLPSMPQDK